MLLNISKLSVVGLTLISASTLASVTTANFGTASRDSNSQFHLYEDGVKVTVSGWADTGNSASSTDDIVRKANTVNNYYSNWNDKYGLAITNQDSDSHTADNYNKDDYDTFLLEFSSAVNLSDATYSYFGDKAYNTQVTVAALSSGAIEGKSWSDIASNQTIASGYSQAQWLSGYYTNFASATSNVAGSFSKYWLVGALNSVFGGSSSDEGDDAFKLSSISFTKGTPPPATSVPEPTSITMFGLALAGLFAVNRRKIK